MEKEVDSLSHIVENVETKSTSLLKIYVKFCLIFSKQRLDVCVPLVKDTKLFAATLLDSLMLMPI